MVAEGTEGQPISITEEASWFEGASNQLSYVNRIPEVIVDEVYHNGFESDARQYEFDCYDFGSNNYTTENNTEAVIKMVATLSTEIAAVALLNMQMTIITCITARSRRAIYT